MAFINGKETLFSSDVILKGLSDADKAEIAEMVNGGIADIEERVSALEEGGGGGKLYLHRISMSDVDMGDYFVGHFYSSNSTPITRATEIPSTFTPVNYFIGYGAGYFIPIGINPVGNELNLYGVELDGGDAKESFGGWSVIDTVTEV